MKNTYEYYYQELPMNKIIAVENEIETEDTSIPAIPSVKNFSYAVVDNKLYFRENNGGFEC